MEHVLRWFLYIDTQSIDDYLSAIEGEMYDEETIKITESSNSNKGIGGKVGPVKGDLGSSKNSETERSRIGRLTDAAKFQKLYKYLSDIDAFGYHETMDTDTWSKFTRNTIIEAAVDPRFSKLVGFSTLADQMSGLGDLISAFSEKEILDDKTMNAISGMKMLGEMQNKGGLPCVMPFIGNHDFKLIAKINKDLLKSTLESLTGEVTVFAKIQRIITKDEKYELVDLIPELNNIPMNREQRRSMPKKSELNPKELKDTIKGPAAIITPIAIYK